MPLPKINASGAADVVKAYDGNYSLDTFIRQAIGKEPFPSFSRANNSPQLIQLLHAFDHQDLPTWPLLSPLKVQMQKCDKCYREFCSTINYRRHMRLHRRNLNLDKDSTTKSRGLLQAFWDKLSVEETKEVMSFEDVSLEGVTGAFILNVLTSLVRKPGFSSLPSSYIRAGSALLDIVQARISRFPVSSQELFSILDGASENTFLCAGTAESLQKYVFDGEVGKIGLEMRNLIACTSFLVEQKLVKVCLADKDAEALRYHKLLVEEEEAAQKRLAALLEKKRMKKLRLKELRAKEQASFETDFSLEKRSSLPSTSNLVDAPDSYLEVSGIHDNHVSSSPEPVPIVNLEGDAEKDLETGYSDVDTLKNVEQNSLHLSVCRNVVNSHWQAPKLQKSVNGFRTTFNSQVLKPGPMQKQISYRDYRSTSAANSNKVWTPKTKSDTDEERYHTRLQVQTECRPSQDNQCEVLIGSIAVTLGSCSSPNNCVLGFRMPGENVINGELDMVEAAPSFTSCFAVELGQHDNGCQLPIQNFNHFSEFSSPSCDDSRECQLECPAESDFSCCKEDPNSSVEDGHKGDLRFSRHVAEAFLSMRWKEAMASDHVKLVLFSEPEPPPELSDVQDNQVEVPSSKLKQRSLLSSSENHLMSYTTFESSAALKSKVRSKPDKGITMKYIPKQRTTS